MLKIHKNFRNKQKQVLIIGCFVSGCFFYFCNPITAKEMFYFGGFGSVLPYILYLSVVWICILVGMNGNIRKIFLSHGINSEEIFIANSPDYNYNTVYDFTTDDTDLSDTNKQVYYSNPLPEYYSLPQNDLLFYRIIFATNCHSGHYLSSRSLRGPPLIFT